MIACRLKGVAPTSAAASQHHLLGISSSQGLELTVSPAALEAAALAGGALQAVGVVAADPAALGAQLAAVSSGSSHSAAYWLDNQTGSSLEVWLSGTKPGGATAAASVATPAGDAAVGGDGGGMTPGAARLLARPAELVVRPGGRAALPVVTASVSQQQGRHVGRPCPLHGVDGLRQERQLVQQEEQQQRSGRLSSACPEERGGGGDGRAAAASTGAAPALETRRPLLYFRLAGQGNISGPLRLDGGSFRGQAAGPTVLSDLQEEPRGGVVLSLHSGVQVSAATGPASCPVLYAAYHGACLPP